MILLSFLPRSLIVSSLTNLCEVPWKPYFLTLYLSYTEYGIPYIYAFAGIVLWNVVSNTATIGTPGMTSLQLFMQAMLPGIWSGPSSAFFSQIRMTSSSMTTEDLKSSPLWSTLCPTALISSVDLIAP